MSNIYTSTVRSSLLEEQYTSATLDCGLKVLVLPKHRATVSCALAARFGSIDTDISREGEKMQKTPHGVAHFLEHMLFESPDGGDAQDDFSCIGAEVNAYTTYDRTVYTVSSSENFKKALELLISMVMTPSFSEAAVLRERSVITEEIQMNADSPWERAYSELLLGMYKSHPVREDICGSIKSVEQITPKLLYTCHDRFYHPSNMVLAVSGDVDAQEIFEAANDALSSLRLNRGEFFGGPRRSFYEGHAIAREISNICTPTAVKPAFSIGIKDVAPMGAKDLLKKDIVMSLVGEMLFSRTADFYNKMFESGIISPDFSHGTSIGPGFAFITLSGEADEPRYLYEEFLKFVDAKAKSGLSKRDFLRNKRIMYADFLCGFDSTDDIASTLSGYATDGICPFEFCTTLESITPEDVNNALFDMAKNKNFALSVAKNNTQEVII